jgi:hypothetical protein
MSSNGSDVRFGSDILGPLVAAYAALDAEAGGADVISPVHTGINRCNLK